MTTQEIFEGMQRGHALTCDGAFWTLDDGRDPGVLIHPAQVLELQQAGKIQVKALPDDCARAELRA